MCLVELEALNTQEGSWGTLGKDYRIRKLTPKECERLQAFPDDWTKYGKDGELISDTQRYKCCGNAVTTNVITAIVDEMFDKVKKWIMIGSQWIGIATGLWVSKMVAVIVF